MAVISSLITDIRLLISDKQSAQWEDDDILSVIKLSVTRANHVLCRNAIQFAKSSHSFNTGSGTYAYPLPSDYMAQAGLFRRDNRSELEYKTDDEWELINSTASSCTIWRVNGTNIEIKGTPSSVIEIVLYYYPLIDVAAYATTTTMPWSGKMDDPIKEYVAVRLSNIDELDVSADLQIMTDIFNHYLSSYTNNTPTTNTVRGWLPYA